MLTSEICLHVKIKANREELISIGIVNKKDQEVLLSGRAIPVHSSYLDPEGRKAFRLAHPTTNESWCHIYEELTEVIH